MSKYEGERKHMHSQTHSCPNLLFHSPALVQVAAATLGSLAAVLPLQRVSDSSFPLFQPWPIPSGFIFTALAQAPNWPLPVSILFIHINPPCRLEEWDYWSMDLMLKNTVILHCPRHTAQAPSVASNVRAHNAPEASLAPHLAVWETPGQGSSPVGPSTLLYLVIVSMAQFVTSNGSNIKMCELFTF